MSSNNEPIQYGEKGATGITRIIRAFFYSLEGIGSAFMHEAAFRQELICALVLVPVVFFIPGTSAAMKALMIASVMLVMVVELLNSAVEAVVDYISEKKHPLAKRAKDMGSAAVLISIASAVMVWAFAIVGAWGANS